MFNLWVGLNNKLLTPITFPHLCCGNKGPIYPLNQIPPLANNGDI